VFQESYRDRAPAGEVIGAVSGDEFEAAVAETGQEGRSAADASRYLPDDSEILRKFFVFDVKADGATRRRIRKSVCFVKVKT
jgi:hypothetical protein